MKIVSGLEKQGYIIYMDNFCSSPTLFKELVNQGFGAVGTRDITRKACPFVLTAQKKKMMKTTYKRGYGVWIRDGPIVYSLWKDTKVVCDAATIHTCNSDHMVKRCVRKDGGGCEEVMVPIPNSIYDYSKQMGGVDRSDHLLQYHQTRQKTTTIGRPCFITVLILQQQMLTSFTDHQFPCHSNLDMIIGPSFQH